MTQCVNHNDRQATHVPWWPFTHFLDVDCGLCPECATELETFDEFQEPNDGRAVEINSMEFWEHERDMREGAWKDGAGVS